MGLLKKKQRRELTRFAEYMVGGGLWFWSGYFIIVFLNGRVPLFWANFIGNAVGITLNFMVERYWAFKTRRPTTLFIATGRYLVYTAVNAFLLNYLILAVFKRFGVGPKYSQFAAAGFFTFWNYYWYGAWVFRGQPRQRRLRHHA